MSFCNLLLWGLPRQYFSNLNVLAALADLAALVAARTFGPSQAAKHGKTDLHDGR